MMPVATAQPFTTQTTATRIVPLTIVVADDVDGIRRLVSQWLADLGHVVVPASTGNEVVRLITDRHFDLIIADVLMPEGDGLEVILAARRVEPSPLVLAISGGGKYMSGTDCLRVAKGIGADGILLKPFTREQMFEAIRRVLEGAEAT
jgi:CheY-like chemotaxis protein